MLLLPGKLAKVVGTRYETLYNTIADFADVAAIFEDERLLPVVLIITLLEMVREAWRRQLISSSDSLEWVQEEWCAIRPLAIYRRCCEDEKREERKKGKKEKGEERKKGKKEKK